VVRIRRRPSGLIEQAIDPGGQRADEPSRPCTADTIDGDIERRQGVLER